MGTQPTLYLVHAVDTEGPLEETLDGTFQRLASVGIDVEPTLDNLRAIQRRELNLGGAEDLALEYASVQRTGYLDTWRKVEEMLRGITDDGFREKHADSEGNPYRFSWFMLDLVGYRDNPRRRPMGPHEVWDQFARISAGRLGRDTVGWHHHTVPVGRHALEYNTCWTNSDHHERILARKIIEKGWFPSCFRAGGAIERNDLSGWLEQFIPFDFSCASKAEWTDDWHLTDWRGAPLEWTGYRPCFRDYRRPGGMRRWMFRCMDIDTNFYRITAEDVAMAFRTVEEGKSAILSFSSHDRRPIGPEVEHIMEIVRAAADRHPGVRWIHAGAEDAARAVAGMPDDPAPEFQLTQEGRLIRIRADREIFGPTPFLAVEEAGGVFFRDNPTIESPTEWAWWVPRPTQTIHIGVAAAGLSGRVGSKTTQFEGREA
ncbi:MAG: hypothetical protein ACPGOU_01235 [Candidatus Nanopelagicales bacterium]